MASVSLAEAVVQQTAIIEVARLELIKDDSIKTLALWTDVMGKALSRIDELCLKRMQQSTYEALRRQQRALLAGLLFPEQASGKAS